MDDLIRREDAIKAIKDNSYALGDDYMEINGYGAIEDIRALSSADRPQGEVDAVEIYERAEHNLEQGYITIGEFDERIEPLRHLCYGRPQGKWKRRLVDNGFNADWICSECGYRVKTDFVSFNYCPNCGARMKGADDESKRD